MQHPLGIEVAMRPCLLPGEGFGDTDVAERLLRIGRMTAMQQSSIRTTLLNERDLVARHMSQIPSYVS